MFEKDNDDVQDFDIDFNANYLDVIDDTIAIFEVTNITTGITLDSSSQSAGVVKLWLSGGTTYNQYTMDVIITTSGGRVKVQPIKILVKS